MHGMRWKVMTDGDVDFVFRVRDEKKFKSLNHLKEQLQKDKKHIDQFLD